MLPGGSKELKLRMVDEGPGGGGKAFVGANKAPRRRQVKDANIGPCGRGVVPGISKELKPLMVDEGPGGGGKELVGEYVIAFLLRPSHA